MLFHHRYPPDVVKAMVEEARNTGEELDPVIVNQPILRLGLALYLNAWFELDYERSRVRLEAIKRSHVWEYARDFDLDSEQTDDLWFYIGRMDREFLDWYAQHLKAATSNGGPSGFKRPNA